MSDSDNFARILWYKTAADAHVFCKWVTPTRRSAFSPSSDVLHYVVGRMMQADGEMSEEPEAPGLHVFRLDCPIPPEVVSADNLMEIRVHVRSEDILHAGVDGRLRVHRLEVMT